VGPGGAGRASVSQPDLIAVRTPLTGAQKLLAVGLTLGVTLIAFDATSVVTALPTITAELDGDSLYGVTLASYTLANLLALVAGGQIADRRGPRPTFLLSIAIFIVGLVVAALAPAMWVVVVGRTLQGLGAGGLQPILYVLVKRAFPDDRQPMIYVFLSSGWVLPSLIAPAFAGVITDVFGWRWVFAGLIPLALLVAVIASSPMRAFGPSGDVGDDDTRRILAAFVATSGVAIFVLGIRSPQAAIVAVAIVIGALLALPALRRLLPAGVERARRGQPAVLSVRLLATATFIGVDGFVPLAADRIHGAKPMIQGFTIVGAALTWTGGAALSAKRADLAPSIPVRWGFVLLVFGVAATAPVLWSSWPLWATFLGWSLGGFGMGLLFNPTTVSAMSYGDDSNDGLVSSQVQLVDALGFSLMGGIGGALVAYADRHGGDLRGPLLAAFGIALVCAVMGFAVSGRVESAPSATTSPG
jgi:MFS family permease